ncbi:MAG: LysM peptidoglycan-binding domain-containing protein [Herpetosiphon sp.]
MHSGLVGVASLGFLGVAAGCVVVLVMQPNPNVVFGRYAIFVPARGPVLEADAFTVPGRGFLPTSSHMDETQVAASIPFETSTAVPTSPSAEPTASIVAETVSPTVSETASGTATVRVTDTARPTNTMRATEAARTSEATASAAVDRAADVAEPTAVVVATRLPTAEEVLPTVTVAKKVPTATVARATRRTYIVKAGDTLRGIAEKFDVTVQSLLDANDLTRKQGDNLQLDQKLIIPLR